MAGRVRAATAYIDIKLGSFTEFKEAAERRAKETAERIAKRMTEDITSNIDGKKAGGKLGDDIANESGKKVEQLGNSLSNKIGPALSRVRSQARDAFGEMGGLVSKVQGGINGLEARLSKVGGVFETVGRKIGFASFMAQGLAYDLTFGVTLPAVAAATAFSYFGVKAALDLEQARASMAPFVGGIKEAQKEIEILADIAAKSPAFDTIQVIAYAKSLIAAGLTVSKTNDLFRASSNIFTTLGLSVDQANGAFYAITQIMQKGKVQSEELSLQLAERGIPIWKILADSLGVTQEKLIELVSQGKVTSTQFVDAMIKAGTSGKYLDGAGLGADTLRAKMASLREQIQYKLAVAFEKHLFPLLNDLADKYGPKLVQWFDDFSNNVLPTARDKIESLVTSLENLKKKWDEIPDATKETIKQFLLLLIAAGPTILAVTKIGSALSAISTAAALLATPVGLAVLAIAAVGFAAYASKKNLEDWFKNTEDGRQTMESLKGTLEDLKNFWNDSLKPALNTVRDAVGEMVTGFVTADEKAEGLKGVMGELRQHLEDVWKDLKEQLIPAWEDFRDGLKAVGIDVQDADMWIGILKGTIKGIAVVIGIVASVVGQGIGQIALTVGFVFRLIANILRGVFDVIVGLFKILNGIVTQDMEQFKEGVRQIWDGLWRLVISNFMEAVDFVANILGKFIDGIIHLWKYLYDVLVGHSIIPDLVNAIIDWFKRLPGRVMTWLSDLVSKGINKFNEFKDKAVSALADLPGRIGEKIDNVKNTILNKVSGFGSLLYNAGKELVQGLINGIGDMIGYLERKVSQLTGLVSKYLPGSPVKKGPLRVLNNGYAGGQIVKMIADGMSTQPVEKAINDVAASALPGIQATGVMASSGSIEPGVNGGITINQNVNVPAPIVNPQAIADYGVRRLVSAISTKATA